MKYLPFSIAAIALLISNGPTRADFVVTGYGYPGLVNDVYEFYALDNGVNGTGTRVASADVELANLDFYTGDIGYGFVWGFVDGTPLPDADVTGVALYHSNADNPAVLFNGHSDRTFVNILGDEATADPTLYHATLTNPDPKSHANYNHPFYIFEQDGNVPGGVDSTPAVNGGRGALIAVVVVKHGDPVLADGTISGLTGPSNGFLVISPEPGSASVLALGLCGLLLPRRRASTKRR